MNQDSKLVKRGLSWLPPLFALNILTRMDNTKGLMAPGRGLPYKSDGDA